jgi:hypothetical protein
MDRQKDVQTYMAKLLGKRAQTEVKKDMTEVTEQAVVAVFGKFSFRISTGIAAIPTEDIRDFPQAPRYIQR